MSLKIRDTSGSLHDVASNVSVDSMVSSTSRNAIQSKAVYQALQGKIDRTVSDLINYYAKSQVYTKTETDALLSAVTTLSLTVVAELPTSDISSNTIYLVGPATGTNKYDEYVRVDNTWIKIGDTDIDLSSYVTNSALELAISDFLTESDVQTLLADYYSKTDIDTMFDYYYTSTEVDNLLDDKADASSLGTAAAKNAPASGNASSSEVVLGNDTRLTDDRNAADVYAWAKEQYKPTYDADEISYDNTDSGLTADDVKAAIDETQEVIADSAETIFKVMGTNGAKNLIPYPYYNGESRETNGITFVVNSDHSVTISGEASADAYFRLGYYTDSNHIVLEAGKSYILSASGDADIAMLLCNSENTNVAVARANDATFNCSTTGDYDVIILAEKNSDFTTPITVYPMLRHAEDTDGTYQQYAKTNKQLTEDVAETTARLDSIDNFEPTSKTVGYANAVSVEDAMAINAVDVTAKIVPNQYMNGYDQPWVGGAGKNMLPLTVDGIKALNTTDWTWSGNTATRANVQFTIVTDDGGNVTGIKINGTYSSGPSGGVTFYLIQNANISIGSGSQGCWNASGSDGNIDYHFNDTTFSGVYYWKTPKTIPESTLARSFIYINTSYNNNITVHPVIYDSAATDFTFEPYTNICPISGYTSAKVTRTGKNMYPMSPYTTGYQKENIWELQSQTYNDHPVYKYTGAWSGAYTPIWLEEGIYTFSFKAKASTSAKGYTFMLGLNNQARVKVLSFNSDEHEEFSLTTSWQTCATVFQVLKAGYLALRFEGNSSPANTSFYFSEYQLELGDHYTSYEAFVDKSEITVDLDGTHYGGTLDFTTGVLTVTHKYCKVEDFTWLRSETVVTDKKRFYTTTSPLGKRSCRDKGATSYCSHYHLLDDTQTYSANEDGYAIASDGNLLFYIEALCTASVENFVAAMTGVEIVYELVTPTTVQLTANQLRMLQGTNTIFINTGETKIVYKDNTVGNLGYQVGDLSDGQFVDVAKGITVELTQNFTTSYEWTVPSSGWYSLVLQNNSADTGYAMTIGLSPSDNATANYIMGVTRTVGQAYDFVYVNMPLKKGTKVLYKYGNSSIQCQARAVRLYTSS